LNSHNRRKKRKIQKNPHDWSEPFKIPYPISSNQANDSEDKSSNSITSKQASPEFQDRFSNNSSIPQIYINNCKNISVDINIRFILNKILLRF